MNTNRSVNRPSPDPPGQAADVAQPLWPDGPPADKASRLERIVKTCRRRHISFRALSIVTNHHAKWFSDKLDVGGVQGYQNWTDDQLAALELLLEDPLRAWPADGRGIHNRTRERYPSGKFRPADS